VTGKKKPGKCGEGAAQAKACVAVAGMQKFFEKHYATKTLDTDADCIGRS
jgi:hypothetical protein